MGGRFSVFQWGSRAGRHLPERTALERGAGYDFDGEVLVIGAGAAGLAAARVLEENGIRYTVLEATDRHGGRLKADASFADFPVDLGAEWIHNRPHILDVMSGAEGTAAQTELVPYHLETPHSWNGRRYKKDSALLTTAAFKFFPEWKFKHSTWYDFVNQHFASKVQHRIRCGAPVAEVDYSGERVQVTTVGGERFIADKVLVTASVGVLRSGAIAFVPGLSERKKEAIASVEFLPGFKLLLKFSEKFYPDAVVCSGGTFTSGEKGFYDMAFGKDSSDNVLAFLVTGAASEPYSALKTEAQMVATVVAELDMIFDSVSAGVASRTFTGEYRLEDWGRKEFTQGTWVAGFKLDQKVVAELNTPVDDKVYFAGEANDPHRQMGVPGAVLSGLDTVHRLLQPR